MTNRTTTPSITMLSSKPQRGDDLLLDEQTYHENINMALQQYKREMMNDNQASPQQQQSLQIENHLPCTTKACDFEQCGTMELSQNCVITVPTQEYLNTHKDTLNEIIYHKDSLTLQEVVVAITHLLKDGRFATDLALVERILSNYQPEKYNDYQQFMYIDPSVQYTRNLVATDGKHWSLLLLCFNPKSMSPIHDHPNCECFVRVVKNVVVEHRYKNPTPGNSIPVGSKNNQQEPQPETQQTDNNDNNKKCGKCRKCLSEVKLIETQRTLCMEKNVSFMNDELGLHKLVNPTNDLTITMHLYFPPYQSCKIYLNESMVATISNICYHSIGGKPQNLY
eukprot:UN03968